MKKNNEIEILQEKTIDITEKDIQKAKETTIKKPKNIGQNIESPPAENKKTIFFVRCHCCGCVIEEDSQMSLMMINSQNDCSFQDEANIAEFWITNVSTTELSNHIFINDSVKYMEIPEEYFDPCNGCFPEDRMMGMLLFCNKCTDIVVEEARKRRQKEMDESILREFETSPENFPV